MAALDGPEVVSLQMLAAHFVADFLLQTNWMAVNKSKRWDALAAHVAVYSLFFALFWGWQFGLITFAAHFVTDAITSRITRRLWPFIPVTGWKVDGVDYPKAYADKPLYVDIENGRDRSRHWFFCVIGIDQLLHYVQLSYTAQWLQ